MAYKHKYVTGETYAFYNNSDELEDNVEFNYWGFDLVHADTFIPVYEDVTVLSKDIISGSDYRWYAEDFTFPDVENGCYRFIIVDTVQSNVLYVSDIIEVVDSTNDLMYARFRNASNMLNYNYEGLPSFNNKTHIEMFDRKPLLNTTSQGYDLTDGSFKRIRTVRTKNIELITGWFDENEHEATQSMIIHSDFYLGLDNEFKLLNFPEGFEYSPDWQENYEFIQVAFRLEIDERSTSNKGI
jgi:hypothetical protein